MLKIRQVSIVLLMLFSSSTSADLQMSVGIGLPNVSIGINVPAYPEFVIVPGYPVYYAPRMEANFFFYDGLYWIYQDDNWYESSWYNGPWWLVDPYDVPLFLLRVPVRYYRMPPAYFVGWQFDAAPRWGNHWGRDWNQRRSGWDRWDHRSIPAPAPLPVYQRNYFGNKYPKQIEHQRELHQQNYGFQSRDPVVRKQNEHPRNIREQNPEQKKPRTDVQHEKPKQGRQEINRNDGTQPIINQRNDSSQQAMPPQQDRSENHDQKSPKNESMNNRKATPTTPQQRDLRAKEPNQRPEQKAIQQHEQQQPVKQNQKQKNQSNNPEKQPRQEQGQERKKDRND
ncbi:MAG: hypothetical protein Q8M99_09020 [Methylotenera sp.]|nr:hypothetical protein [Methylotenera sp.]